MKAETKDGIIIGVFGSVVVATIIIVLVNTVFK